jgi:tetratricopeptide (TPR) repeat protein
VLRYQCSPFHVSSALHPVIDHLERAAGFGREDTPEHKLDKLQALLAGSEAQVAEAAPLFAALLSLPLERYPPLKLSPQKQKEKTLEALARQVEALAQRQPLLVIYEDAHWIDPTSQEALDLLVPRLQRLPVLLILTYRPEYSPRWSEQAHVTILGLSRLGRRQGSELVSKLTGGKTLPQEVLDQILARADGVPLFIEELTKSVLESGLLREDRNGYVLQAPLAALAIPTTLRDSLIARLDRLAPIREVAQIGACIGREFSFELLSALSSMEGPRLEDALDQLTTTGLVFRRGTSPGAVYTFKHALVQDAAYDSLLKSTRQQLHSKIARVLEERFPTTRDTQPETLAHHYTAAGLTEEAIGYWRKAGELALQRVALHEAVAHLNRGLELIGALPVSSGRDARELALRTSLGTAWLGLCGWAAPEVEASFTPALRLAKSLDHRPSYRPVLNGLYMYALAGGRVAESLKWVGEVQGAAEALDDLALRLMGHRLAQVTHFYLGRFEEARWHSDRIAALYNADQGRDSERLTNFYALNSRGVYGAPGLWLLGYPDQALRLYQATQAHARARGHPFGLCFVLTVGSWVCELRGELDRLLADVEEGERLGRAHSIPLFSEVLAPLYKGVAWLRKGRTSEGISQLRDALGRWTAGGAQVVVPYWKAVLAEGIARTGDLEQGLGLVEECFAQMERPGWEERWPLAEVLRIKGWMLKLQGKLDEAGQSLRAAIDVARQQQAKSWELRSATTLAGLLTVQGQRGAARDLLAPVYGWFTEGLDTQDLKQAKVLLEELS